MQIPRLILIQSELGPQINPPDFFVRGETRGRAALENHPAMHDVGTVGDAQGFADVVVSYEHSNAAVAEVKDDLLNVRDGDWIDAGKGLVEQDELRRDDQRPRNLGAPTFAARQRVRRRLCER